MPQVAARITNNATNISHETLSNEEGIYRFVAVEPGIYTVQLSKVGFETRRVENVQVTTNQDVTLNQTLAIATAATTIDVIAAPAGVELAKGSATIERTLPRVFIENVALSGAARDISRLALLAPTVTRGPGTTDTIAYVSANGNRTRNNNYMLDGVDNNDSSTTTIANRSIPEGVAEFQVQTSSYSSEYGRNSGAQMNVITKSGSNVFHGEAFDYYRGNWMEPVSLLNKRVGLNKTPRFVHNQAGGALGGRIIEDRTFFFGLVETNRRREAADARNATSIIIPTPAGYAGLSDVPLRAGQSNQSRQAVLGALSFLPEIHQQVGNSYRDLRTLSVNGVPIEVGTAGIPLAKPYDYWFYLGRIDHKLTNSQNLTYRLQIDKRNQTNEQGNLGFGDRFSAAQVTLGPKPYGNPYRDVESDPLQPGPLFLRPTEPGLPRERPG